MRHSCAMGQSYPMATAVPTTLKKITLFLPFPLLNLASLPTQNILLKLFASALTICIKYALNKFQEAFNYMCILLCLPQNVYPYRLENKNALKLFHILVTIYFFISCCLLLLMRCVTLTDMKMTVIVIILRRNNEDVRLQSFFFC